MKTYSVVQSNTFIRDFSLDKKVDIVAIKLFKAILAKVNNNDTLFKDFYEIDYKTLDLAGVPKNNRFEIIRESLKTLANTYIKMNKAHLLNMEDLPEDSLKWVRTMEDDDELEIGVINNRFIYKKRTGKITLSLAPELREFFLNLSKEYTIYDLEYLRKLNTNTEVKLYEILKSWANKGEFFITLDNLKIQLDLKAKQYEQYFNLKKLLKKSIYNITMNTDLYVEFKEYTEDSVEISPNQRSLKVFKLQFVIKDKDSFKEIDIYSLLYKRFKDQSGKILIIIKIEHKGENMYDMIMSNVETGDKATLPKPLPKEVLYNWVNENLVN